MSYDALTLLGARVGFLRAETVHGIESSEKVVTMVTAEGLAETLDTTLTGLLAKLLAVLVPFAVLTRASLLL